MRSPSLWKTPYPGYAIGGQAGTATLPGKHVCNGTNSSLMLRRGSALQPVAVCNKCAKSKGRCDFCSRQIEESPVQHSTGGHISALQPVAPHWGQSEAVIRGKAARRNPPLRVTKRALGHSRRFR